jgi:signal transduction histidine kinase
VSWSATERLPAAGEDERAAQHALPASSAPQVLPGPGFLSTAVAERGERNVALAVVVVSAAIFICLVPFAKVKLAPVPAFIAFYQSALVINDLVTAFLLVGQFAILGSRGLLVLAAGYLFTALMAAIHALSFPGLVAPAGVLGGNMQTTAWLYMFWHAGFPLLVIAYTTLAEPVKARAGALAGSAVAVVAAASGLTLLATEPGMLPAIMEGNGYTPLLVVVVSVTWLSSVAAAWVLWRRRAKTVLDLWLLVVMCAWAFEIGLSAVFNAGRFDLGFYAGRLYGLIAASAVLGMLLVQQARLYQRLASAHGRAERRLRMLHEIEHAVIAGETPQAIASAVVQPLRDLLGVPRVVVNRFDLAAGEAEWIAAAGRRRSHVGPGVRYPLVFMGDVEALRRNEPQLVDIGTLPPGQETDALAASGVSLYMVVPMIASGELIGAISFGGARGSFSEEQVDIGREAAAQLAIAIAMAQLMDKVRRHAEELETRVRERTAELKEANRELEAFSYSVSHDLRAPLRAIDGYARMLDEDYAARLDDEGRRLLGVVQASAQRMGQLIDDLLAFSRLGRQALARQGVDMEALAREVAAELVQGERVTLEIGKLPAADADRALMRQVWTNLIGNALKYSGRSDRPRVEIGCREGPGERVYWVRDNGAGFDMRYAAKLFGVFQRLHSQDEFAGTGVGLAIVQRVVARHGGRVWAEGKPGAGACFFFSLPA